VIPQASAAVVRHDADPAERFRSHILTYHLPPEGVVSTRREADGGRLAVHPAVDKMRSSCGSER
jgi:hypothetical protein